MKNKLPILAITLGDLKGIGPEIVKKSLERINLKYPILIIGEKSSFSFKNINYIKTINEINKTDVYFMDIQTKTNIHNSFEFIRKAINLALEKKITAIITAPISKENWGKTGITYKGHTGYLAESAKIQKYAMAFWSNDMRVVLYTTHIPLKEVAPLIRKSSIVEFIEFVNNELTKKFKQKFKILVSGFNPHAGENGIIGKEEVEEIIPAINILKKKMDIDGPYPPDTVFLKARKYKNAVVISWYHDQGLIPFKLLNINSGVNLTLGLPYIRTSPDHGTAFDIAGKNIADPSSMVEAILLAQKLVEKS